MDAPSDGCGEGPSGAAPSAHSGAAPAWLRRFCSRADPDCWIGLVTRVIAAASEERDGTIVHTPDHYLGAAWAPRPQVLRWPEVVVIGSPAADNAIAELFANLPGDARLYLADLDQVDAALAAEILRRSDSNLEPYQQRGIEAFIAAQRERDRALIEERYTDRDAGYERFRAVLLREIRSDRAT